MTTNLTDKSQFDTRGWLFWSAIAFAIGEFIDAYSLADPTTGIIFAVLVAACAGWLRMRPSRIPVVVLLILSALELAALVFIYPHGPTPPALWRSAIFVLLSAAVAILSIISLVRQQTTPSS